MGFNHKRREGHIETETLYQSDPNRNAYVTTSSVHIVYIHVHAHTCIFINVRACVRAYMRIM